MFLSPEVNFGLIPYQGKYHFEVRVWTHESSTVDSRSQLPAVDFIAATVSIQPTSLVEFRPKIRSMFEIK
jgi:hypothetical protein